MPGMLQLLHSDVLTALLEAGIIHPQWPSGPDPVPEAHKPSPTAEILHPPHTSPLSNPLGPSGGPAPTPPPNLKLIMQKNITVLINGGALND